MRIVWDNWLIESHDKGDGYVIKRRRGARYRVESYHSTLACAARSLFEERVRTETMDDIINTINKASARVSTATLIAHIENIADEIEEGLSYEY